MWFKSQKRSERRFQSPQAISLVVSSLERRDLLSTIVGWSDQDEVFARTTDGPWLTYGNGGSIFGESVGVVQFPLDSGLRGSKWTLEFCDVNVDNLTNEVQISGFAGDGVNGIDDKSRDVTEIGHFTALAGTGSDWDLNETHPSNVTSPLFQTHYSLDVTGFVNQLFRNDAAFAGFRASSPNQGFEVFNTRLRVDTAGPDIAVSSLNWKADGAAELQFSISTITPVSHRVSFFWSRNATVAGITGRELMGVVIPPTSIGERTVNVPGRNLDRPPTDAKYLIAMADYGNRVSESNEANNVIALRIEDGFRVNKAVLQDPLNGEPLRYLSVSTDIPRRSENRIRATVEMTASPLDSVRSVRLEIIQSGVIVATVPGDLSDRVLNQLAGRERKLRISASQLSFGLNRSVMAVIDSTHESTITLRVIVQARSGATSTFDTSVPVLTQVNQFWRIGNLDENIGGNNWVRPSLVPVLKDLNFHESVLWAEASYLNGATPRWGVTGHENGVVVRGTIRGFSSLKAAGAKSLIRILNEPRYQGRISKIEVAMIAKPGNAFYDAIRNFTLADGRKAIQVIVDNNDLSASRFQMTFRTT